jgi:hypothetical protein
MSHPKKAPAFQGTRTRPLVLGFQSFNFGTGEELQALPSNRLTDRLQPKDHGTVVEFEFEDD